VVGQALAWELVKTFLAPRFSGAELIVAAWPKWRSARVQRLLWASTGTKNPDYSDVKYVEALIGAYTVYTVPVETLDTYRDHGEPNARLELKYRR